MRTNAPPPPPLLLVQDEVGTPIKQDTKKGKLRFYPYNINWCEPLLIIFAVCTLLSSSGAPASLHLSNRYQPCANHGCKLPQLIIPLKCRLRRNYGLLPQTWEDPGHKQADLNGIAVSSHVVI